MCCVLRLVLMLGGSSRFDTPSGLGTAASWSMLLMTVTSLWQHWRSTLLSLLRTWTRGPAHVSAILSPAGVSTIKLRGTHLTNSTTSDDDLLVRNLLHNSNLNWITICEWLCVSHLLSTVVPSAATHTSAPSLFASLPYILSRHPKPTHFIKHRRSVCTECLST